MLIQLVRLTALCGVVALSLPSGAVAQSTPAGVPIPTAAPTTAPLRSITQAVIDAAAGFVSDAIARNRANAANTTLGTVTFFHRYDLQVQTGPSSYRDVHLHPGTVIHPRGATPSVGTTVSVNGHGQSDGSLDADLVTVAHS